MGKRETIRTIFVLLVVLLLALPASAHSRTELDAWVADWIQRADHSLSPGLIAEGLDMRERHPYYFAPKIRVPISRSPRAGVEQWRDLVSDYFSSSQVETALRVMACESSGDPDAYNSRSGASGLFQHLPKYWSERSREAGIPGADIFDPVANVRVAAWLQASGGWRHWNCYSERTLKKGVSETVFWGALAENVSWEWSLKNGFENRFFENGLEKTFLETHS